MRVAVDVHDRPEDVLTAALPWAKLLKRRVDLVFASEWSTEGLAPPHPTEELQVRIAEWAAKAAEERAALSALVARLPEAYRGQAVFLTGRPLDVLPTSTPRGAITVVATHGRGPVGRALLGSVSARLIRSAPGEVLVLHLDGAAPQDEPTVLVPVDLEHGASALAAVRRLLPMAAIELVYVLPRFGATFGSAGPATAALRTLARAHGVPEAVLSVLPVSDRPGEALADHAAHSRVDLVAMPTHSRAAPVRWALGSVTERVVHRASVPVLVTRL